MVGALPGFASLHPVGTAGLLLPPPGWEVAVGDAVAVGAGLAVAVARGLAVTVGCAGEVVVPPDPPPEVPPPSPSPPDPPP